MDTCIVNKHKWVLREELKNDFHWTSEWWCSDGDGVDLLIGKDQMGFELSCFSGIPASHIYIDRVDFGVLLNKTNVKDFPKEKLSFDEQCIVIADYLCSLFCEYSEPTLKSIDSAS